MNTLEQVRHRYQSEGEHRWIDQLAWEVEKVLKQKEFYISAFLNPLRRKIAEEVLAAFPRSEYVLFGGYPGAQRVRLSVWTSGALPSSYYPPVSAVRITGNFKKGQLHEREVLGALMEAGLSRDMIGDIIWDSQQMTLQAMIIPEKVPELEKANKPGGLEIEVEEIELASVDLPYPVEKEIKGTVASLRLDSVMSVGLGISRSKASSLAKSGQVLINYRKETSPSYKVKQGDVVSLSGGGSNLKVQSLEGESRKGRQRIIIKKFVT